MKFCKTCNKEFKEKQKTEVYCCTHCAYEGMRFNNMRKYESPFKNRVRTQVIGDTKYKILEYQCPVCKRWTSSYYNGYTTQGIRLHISKTGKSEAIAKALGEMKETPHFAFWKKYTKASNFIYNPREWKI